ncbi:DNA oxidative demethylase AlkB [Niveibacterium umoris]|uniref:Alkylated DNA repair protein (DNA oxidative demethylase) n=1 Tax=Niveibacterium umoris TaxID=1193620 RepID=A0A840BL09_9RHOO|nr:DNA oxidative demethylase AlkB [Niveibacterium umoris]MBB4013303.1 alkylated DNA repair protein (DNA oxidative demethylase) [Niveibacterium umoris]
MAADLFGPAHGPAGVEPLSAGTFLLHGFAEAQAPALLEALGHILAQSPLRHLITPGGQRMSVAMSNCGPLGWVSDRSGYRYQASDPETGQPWPPMPDVLRDLARSAATLAGFPDFAPDACLINRYAPGTRLSLHQDRDERDLSAPIVSVSLGLPAVFLFGGLTRSDPVRQLTLYHGDVLVWGGPDRLRFHGVKPLAEGIHSLLGAQRINLTFRRAA